MSHSAMLKLNAAGLSAESSLLLPERAAGDAAEAAILQSVRELYAAAPSTSTFVPFANEIILTLPNGDVAVGAAAFEAKFRASWTATPHRRVQLRLLESPESLAAGTLCVDVVVAAMTDAGEAAQVSKSTRNLVVLKRNAEGRVANMTEEEGHRRATAPLAARTAAASNFYSHSPTDNMVSPCTSKLNLSKKKHFMKAKPTTLFPSATSRTPTNLRANSADQNMAL